MCVVCAVSPVSRLTAQSDPRHVFSSCREPSQPAHGIPAWSRVLRVYREPPRKLTAKRPLCGEPDVWLTAALRFPVVLIPEARFSVHSSSRSHSPSTRLELHGFSEPEPSLYIYAISTLALVFT